MTDHETTCGKEFIGVATRAVPDVVGLKFHRGYRLFEWGGNS